MKISRTLSATVKRNGSIISVIGALVLFFSWSVRNTIYERYAHLKTAIQSAEQTFRLYSTLHELRNNVNSLAIEVVQQKKASRDASQYRAGLTGFPGIDDAQRRFDLTRLSAHQMTELMDFATKTNDVSVSVGGNSLTADSILMKVDEIKLLRDSVSDYEREVDKVRYVTEENVPFTLLPVVDDYCDFWRYVSRQRVPQLYATITKLSNKRLEEAHDVLLIAEDNSSLADSWAFYLYLIGTLMALGGQAIDKFIKNDVNQFKSDQEIRSLKRRAVKNFI